MSDDLISRKDLIGTERLLTTDIVENNPTAKDILEQVLHDIEHAPRDFDKKKVIEELKTEGCIIDDEAGNRADEIVEKGGIE